MEWSLAHQDPRAPMFQRQNDLVLQWGGPNADNIYRHARVHPSLHVPHRRTHALVRGLHPRHPSQLHAHGDQRHHRRAERARARPRPGRRLRDPARRRGRRAEPRAAPRRRAVGVDPRVLLRLAAARAGDVHHRVPRRRRARPRRSRRRASRSGSTKRPRTSIARSRTGTSTCSTRAPSRPTTCSAAATT